MAKVELTKEQRLQLIIEAINYCNKVKEMGMSTSCYSKALREPIFFLWENSGKGSKYKKAKFRSLASLGVEEGKNLLRYDHSIPFSIVQEQLLSLNDVSLKTVEQILDSKLIACTITKEEDALLNKAGLNSKMPENWDGVDPLARYREVNIKITENF